MWYCLRLAAAQDTTQACHVHVADTKVLFTLHSNSDLLMQGDCCAACEALSGCNVWVWCASYGGCKYGDNGVFPMYGCDLKHQDNYTDMSQLPLAYSRGPPTPFTSGMLLMLCKLHHSHALTPRCIRTGPNIQSLSNDQLQVRQAYMAQQGLLITAKSRCNPQWAQGAAASSASFCFVTEAQLCAHAFFCFFQIECSSFITNGKQPFDLSTTVVSNANVLTCSAVQVATSMEPEGIHACNYVIHQYLQAMFT